MLDRTKQNLREGLRALRTAPLLSAIVIVTLGIALAASVTAFSVLNASVLQPLPFREPGRVLFLSHEYRNVRAASSPPLFLDYRRSTRSFESVSAAMPWNANLTGAGEPERLRGLLVSADFFSTLGVDAVTGRVFLADEETPGRDRVVVISHGLWQRRFGGAAGVVGSTLRLNGEPYEVVGIMPPGFEWGRAYGRDAQGELWAPFALTPARVADDNRGSEFLDVYARLRGDVTTDQAQADINSLIATLRGRFPKRYTEASGFGVRLVPLQQEAFGQIKPALVIVFVAVVLLLVVAATNVASLLRTRAAGRRRELSTRAALGASPRRLVGQFMAESAVLVSAAGALGLTLAWLATSAIAQIDPVALPRARPIAIDAFVGACAVGLMAVLACAIGFVPSRQARRADLMTWLKTAKQSGASREVATVRRVLIVVQTAIALTLLIGGGLLVRSVSRLDSTPLGFTSDGVLAAQLQLPRTRYTQAVTRSQLVDQIVSRSAGRLGILSAGVVSELPLGGSSNSGTFEIDGRPVDRAENLPHAELWSASPTYFPTLGIPLTRGRLFDARDSADRPAVAIVSEALAARYFPGVDPIGQRIDFEGGPGARSWREIVGVVGDVRDRRLDKAAEPQLYVPYGQRSTGGLFVVVRRPGEAASALPDVRAVVRELDPDLPIYNATTMADLQAKDTRDRRIVRSALVGFAAAALLLAALGLYGLLSQMVRDRVPEIGVRMALGASPADMMRLVLREAASVGLFGMLGGLATAFAATRLLKGLLFGVSTTDPLTYIVVPLLLAMVILAACALPARRAARVDPLVALRSE
jgi:predicted permease